MRLGGPLFGESTDADSWIKLVKNHGYSAAYCPVSSSASEREAQEYVTAAKENNIVIAEVGAWSNPISTDVKETRLEHNELNHQIVLIMELV